MSDNPQRPVTVVASFRVRPGHLDDVLPLVAACVRASRQEAANLSYSCRRDLADPLHFVFVERWDNIAALHAHEEQAHFLAMKAAFDTGLDGPLSVTLLEDVDRLS